MNIIYIQLDRGLIGSQMWRESRCLGRGSPRNPFTQLESQLHIGCTATCFRLFLPFDTITHFSLFDCHIFISQESQGK